MKKITSLFVMAFLLIGTLGFVVAAEEDSVPEANKIGFFEDRMDRMKLAFTFNQEKKIGFALEMAEKRLAEAEALIDEDPEAYERAQARYDELVAKAEEVLEKIEAGENGSAENLAKLARIQNRFEKHLDQADEMYTRARERFELNNASEEKIQRFEQFHERALNRSDAMEEKILEKKDNAIRKYKVSNEMSDEELEELLADVESEEGLTEAREARMEKFEERTGRLEEQGIRQTERIEAQLRYANIGEEQKAQLRARLENHEDNLEALQDKTQDRIYNRTQDNLYNMTQDKIQNRTQDRIDLNDRMRDAIEDELSDEQA